MTVGRVNIAKPVDRHAERIHLPLGIQLNARTIRAKAKCVAGRHLHSVPVFTGHVRTIVESMARINPAVFAASECIAHAVCVTSCIERTVQHFAFIACAVAVCVMQKPDVWNAETDDSIAVRNESDRDVEFVCKDCHNIRFAIAVCVFQNANRVARRHVCCSREGIFQ